MCRLANVYRAMPLHGRLLLLFSVSLLSRSGAAQEAAALPSAPMPQQSAVASQASLSGTVVDQRGSLVPGARVEIVQAAFKVVDVTDGLGEFQVQGLAPGSYVLRVTANGFRPSEQPIALLDAERKDLPAIQLQMAGKGASVTVVATEQDVAAAEVHLEEKQRVLGIIPNFYVVYATNPAPISSKQKFQLALRSTVDPVSFLGTAVVAGIEQSGDEFGGYGQGAAGYAKRYGANFADGAIGTFMGGAILPSLFHQDPRYYYQGTGSTRSRAWHAISSVVICRGDNGKLQFNASNVLGSFASAGISNIYYPASDRHRAGLTMGNAATGIGFGAFAALMQEFVVKKLTPHLPNYRGAPTDK